MKPLYWPVNERTHTRILQAYGKFSKGEDKDVKLSERWNASCTETLLSRYVNRSGPSWRIQ